MGALHFTANVTSDHKLEIALPPTIPPGPVEVTLNVPGDIESTPGLQGEALDRWLDGLRRLREKYRDRGVTLSDAVIENRREERY